MAALFKLNEEQRIEFAQAYSLSSVPVDFGPVRLTADIKQKIDELNTTKKHLLISKPTDNQAMVILTNKMYATKLHVTEYQGMKIAVIGMKDTRTVVVFLLQEISHFKEDGIDVNVYAPMSSSFELCVDSMGLYYE